MFDSGAIQNRVVGLHKRLDRTQSLRPVSKGNARFTVKEMPGDITRHRFLTTCALAGNIQTRSILQHKQCFCKCNYGFFEKAATQNMDLLG